MYRSIDRFQVDSSSNRNSMAATSDSPSSLPRPLRSFSPWSVAFRSIIRAYQRQSANPSCLPSSSSSVSVSSVTSSKPLVPLPIARGTRPTTLEMLPSDPARLDFLISPSKCQSTRYVLSLLSCSIIADPFSTRLGSHRRDSRPLSFLPSNRSRRLSRRTSVREEPSRSLFARMVCRSVQLPRTRSRLVSTPDSLSLTSSQLWSEADAEVRKAYYDRNAIGWVARPKHGKDGFIRKGRFKKVRLPLFSSSLPS
jgi:hypothetical protein